MKLLVVIVQDNDVNLLMDDLVENKYSVTKLATTGGFLKEGNTTLLIGVDEEKVQDCIALIDRNCKKRRSTTFINPSTQGVVMQSIPIEVEVGGATVFVLDVDQFLKL